MLDGPRKRIAPRANLLRAIDASPRDQEPALQQFINQSPWADRPVRDRRTQRVVANNGDATEFREALPAAAWPYCGGICSTLEVVAADHDFGPGRMPR